jgi:hypothetical protein
LYAHDFSHSWAALGVAANARSPYTAGRLA